MEPEIIMNSVKAFQFMIPASDPSEYKCIKLIKVEQLSTWHQTMEHANHMWKSCMQISLLISVRSFLKNSQFQANFMPKIRRHLKIYISIGLCVARYAPTWNLFWTIMKKKNVWIIYNDSIRSDVYCLSALMATSKFIAEQYNILPLLHNFVTIVW